MERYPALALIEFSSIPTGILAGDAMIKRAPLSILKTGTVHPGKHVVLVGGSVAAVEEAFAKGVAIGGDQVIDRVFLADVHEQVYDAVLNKHLPCNRESLGIVETGTMAATIKGADAAVKGAVVDIMELRLADDLGGKAFTVFTGAVEEVQAAVELAQANVTDQQFWLGATIIPRLHEDMVQQIETSTHFATVPLQVLPGGEF